jgi:aspartate aminotransferase
MALPQSLASRAGTLGTEGALAIGSAIARCVARGDDVVRLNIGEPDFDAAPHIVEAGVRALREGNAHYVAPEGVLSLRRAVAAHITRTRGVPVDPERVIVTPGAKLPIAYTLQTYVNPGDEVIYTSPGFPIFESWIPYVGAVPVPVVLREESRFELNADELASKITPRTKLIMLCSPSNPTGSAFSAANLAAIAHVIRELAPAGLRIYSDEVYEHIVYDGAAHHSIASQPGMAERTVLVSGFSKGFAMTGWRLGYAVLPSVAEADAFRKLNINHVTCVPPFVQEAGREALESSESAAAVAAMVQTFQQRRDWIIPALDAIPGMRCSMPAGAFYAFPNVERMCERLGILDAFEGLPQEQKVTTSPSRMLQLFLLDRHGIATNDRASFCVNGSEGQHFLRISFAASDQLLRSGINRLEAASGDEAGYADFFARDRMLALEG